MLAQQDHCSEEPGGPTEPHKLISAADVRTMFGDVTDMTIWRWLKDPDLNFPKPIYVMRRRFWRLVELTDWIDNQPRANEERV
jgi:predicted DNA-binding transcriptional regulator AlpA